MGDSKKKVIVVSLALFLTVLFIGYLGPVITGNVVKETDAVTLADFPYPFIKNGVLNRVVIVVPDAPSADELLAAHDLSLLFDNLLDMRPQVQTASAVAGEVANKIVIGNVCSALIQETRSGLCGTLQGEGLLRVDVNGDAMALVVTGERGEDVRVAAKAVVLYKKYVLKGQEMRVRGSLDDPFGFVLA